MEHEPGELTLKTDIRTNFNKKPTKSGGEFYGLKGEQVRLIAEHGNVLIVEGKKERFPVKKENVNDGL